MKDLKKEAEIAFRESKPYLSDFNDFQEFMNKALKSSSDVDQFLEKIADYPETEPGNKDLETDVKIFKQKFKNLNNDEL